jgi:deoxyxylulose-5-phosphate synthase
VSLVDGMLVDSYGDDAWNGHDNQNNLTYFQLMVVHHMDQKRLDKLGQKKSLAYMIEDAVRRGFGAGIHTLVGLVRFDIGISVLIYLSIWIPYPCIHLVLRI